MIFCKKVVSKGCRPQPFLKPGLKSGRQFLRQLGVKLFVKKINEGKTFDEAAKSVVFQTAIVTQVAAQKLAPVDTARLKNSIYIVGRGDFKFAIGTNVYYAIFQELGTGLYGPYHQTFTIVPKTPGGVLAFAGAPRKTSRSSKSGKSSKSRRR